MKHRLWVVALVVLLVLILGVGGAIGQEGEGSASVTASVDSAISYQGVLKFKGAPVTGSRDMVFRLYTDDTCASQVGSDIVRKGVSVADGLFSVDLDVNQSDLNGQGLWLEVDVGGTVITCQEIRPVPYALSLRPGAVINGGTTGLTLSSGDTGLSASGSAKGVFASASGTSGTNYGLRAETNSTDGHGVHGWAGATSGTTYGVYGESSSTTGGYGGYFTGHHGVYGKGSGASSYGGHFESANYHSGHGGGGPGTSDDGIHVYSAGDDGVRVGSAGGDGVDVHSAGGDGVHVFSADGFGVYVGSSGYAGVYVDYADGDGVYVHSAGGDGVYANTTAINHEWGLKTPDKLYVGTTMASGGALTMVAQNGGAGALEVGDVVAAAGLGAPFADSDVPIPLVQRADADHKAVVGVVYGRFTAEKVVEEREHEGKVEQHTTFDTHSAEGPVAPGDYLLIVVLGVAEVKVEASAGAIEPGQRLTVSELSGHARILQTRTLEGMVVSEGANAIGVALAPLDALQDAGTVLVFVTLK